MVEPGGYRLRAPKTWYLNDERFQISVPVDLKSLLDTAADGLRFVTEFFEVINESVPHIYHSALPLAPASSIIRKLYSQQISSAARVVTGASISWDSCTAIAGAASEPSHSIWSPCGQFIATGSERKVEVRDSTTLGMLYDLEPPNFDEDFYPNVLIFSPDGHLLICAYEEEM